MEINGRVLKFLNKEDVQDALARNDTQELYKLATDASRQRRLLVSDIGELTSILMQAGIDPLLGMTEIPVYFLYMQEGIKEFNIPQGITKINNYAFAHAGLETVKLPAGVKLYKSVFSLSGLESIELKDVKLQDSSIFWSCEQLKSVIIRGNTPVIPDHTFANCTNLTHVELPEALKQIGHNVFHGCDKLREINFAGIVDQWKNIEINESNGALFGCKIICSDGTLKFDKTAKEWIEA